MTIIVTVILGWFVDKEEVTAVMKYPKNLIEETSVEVLLEKLPDAVLDENVDINLVRHYFSNDAWILVQDVVTRKKRNPVYTCKTCQHDLNEFPAIVCDHCLSWYHMKCVGLKQNPKAKHWFCRDCYKK